MRAALLLILLVCSCRRADPPEAVSIKGLIIEGKFAEAEGSFDRLTQKMKTKNEGLLCDLGRGVLKAHLKSPERNLRYHATVAFYQFEEERDIPILIEGLKDPFYKVQTTAAEALGDWDNDAYKETLYQLLEMKEPPEDAEEARFLAAAVLLKYGDKKGLPELLKILVKGDDPKNRRRAAAALGEWGPDDKEVIDHLKFASLKDENLFVRIDAFKSLGDREGPKEALAGLRAIKESGNIFVSIRALAALSSLGDEVATRELMKYADHEDQKIRMEALLTAGDLGFPEAFPLLVHVMKAEDIPSRAKAALLLGDTGDSKYLPDMKKIFAEIDDRSLRINFVKAMAEIALEEDLYFMKDLVPNEDPFVEIYAARSLCLIYNRYK